MYKTVSLSILAMLVFAGWIETAAIAQIEVLVYRVDGPSLRHQPELKIGGTVDCCC